MSREEAAARLDAFIAEMKAAKPGLPLAKIEGLAPCSEEPRYAEAER